jgi:transaldolase
MENESYLQWLVKETRTTWWHDSGDPGELDRGLDQGATGVTTNPVLTHRALGANLQRWRSALRSLDHRMSPAERAEALMRIVVCDAALKLEDEHRCTAGRLGYVCAQVDPAQAGDREAMLAMARRFHAWAPNVAVKLPVTAAGLDVLEECVAEGITVTATVSFTVPQVVAVAERHRRGASRARQQGRAAGRCFAVIMIGRIDDYLRDVFKDRRANVTESESQQAGLAVAKRAYSIYQAQGYEATLLVAALRGTYHMTELAGAELIMSIHPRYQAMLLQPGVPREERINIPIDPRVIAHLQAVPEFVRSYEPDGMAPEDFIAFGVTQRTLSQFTEIGWALLESFDLPEE